MSLATKREADARMRPAAIATGTRVRTLAWMPKASDVAPTKGSTRATPGIAKSDMVVKAAERLYAGGNRAALG